MKPWYKELSENLLDFFFWVFSLPLALLMLIIKNNPKPVDDSLPPSIPPETPNRAFSPTKEVPHPTNSLLWDNPQNVRHSIRVLGDEYNLTWNQKDLLCDIARCESAFNPKATLKNSPTSIDRGLFQWNSHWHPEITDEIAYDPEKNTRLAIKALIAKKCKTYWLASAKCWNVGHKYDALL